MLPVCTSPQVTVQVYITSRQLISTPSHIVLRTLSMLSLYGSDYHTAVYENDHPTTYKVIQVIGAGLPRTGTLSLSRALSQLYEGPCYHMMEVFRGDQEDVDIWMDAIDGKVTPEDWKEYFEGKAYVAGVDFPFSLFWSDISAAYPDAKVILSTRDPTTWYDSVFNSIWQFGLTISRSWTLPLLLRMMDRRKGGAGVLEEKLDTVVPDGCQVSFGEAIEGGPEVAEKFFRDWEEAVKKSVPEEKLLIHRSSDGWETLCKFLGKPVPDNEYPMVNGTQAIKKGLRNLQVINALVFFILPGALAFAGYSLM